MALRIIAGRFRGRLLTMPPATHTRPTSDRLRETLFNILAHRFAFDFDGAYALDVFAGSGAFGFEFLSRGGTSVCFVEMARAAVSSIRTSITALDVKTQTQVLIQDALKLKTNTSDVRYNLIFLDPPYHKNFAQPALLRAEQSGWLSDDCLAVVEMGSDEPAPVFDGWQVEDTRAAGAAKLVFLRRL